MSFQTKPFCHFQQKHAITYNQDQYDLREFEEPIGIALGM